MDSSKRHILDTLSYFDFFDYPLTEKELWHFTNAKKSEKDFYQLLKKANVPKFNSFYFRKRKSIVKKRLEKEKISKRKLKKAIKIIHWLSFFPTVDLIGISGSLAMQNSNLEDDIDIFVICQNNLVWLTRLALVVFLSIIGAYRRKHEKNPKNKICLNLIIGNKNILLNKKRQNLYTAHEIVQLAPIFQRENLYSDFINKNKWVFDFLPNSSFRIQTYKIPFNRKTALIENILIKMFHVLKLEKIAKFFQWNYMKKDITLETIEDNFLAFHPINFEKRINNFLNRKE